MERGRGREGGGLRERGREREREREWESRLEGHGRNGMRSPVPVKPALPLE
jgi:hypothetical protein